MHHTIPSALMSVAMASRSVILEAPDDTCGYLNGIQMATFGCHETSERCAIYYPTSSMADQASVDTTMVPMITPAPQASMVCCEPSRGDCTVQPTACVDNFKECTGTCPIDPLTLKCTTRAHSYCNRAQFESPLSFHPIDAPDSRLRPTDAPADGWFCGPSAISIQHTDASHNSRVSMAHMNHSSISPTTTLSVTITLSKPGMGPGPSVSPSTTLNVTITLSKPGLGPGPSLGPSPPAAVDSEDFENREDAPSSYDCCLDEPGTSEPCYFDIRRARLQRRQAVGGSATAASPPAAPGDEISRRSAIVFTAYTGQTDRAPFVEATRVWNVVTPTAVANSTTKTTIPTQTPPPPKGKHNQLNSRQKIAIGVTVGLLCVLAMCCIFAKKYRDRSISRHQQHLEQHQNGHAQNGPPVHVSHRQNRFLQREADLVADPSLPQVTTDHGDIQGQLGRAFGGQPDSSIGVQPDPSFGEYPGPAFGMQRGRTLRRHQHVLPESDETTDFEEDLEPQSEDSLEREAYERTVGVAVSEDRHRAYNNRI